MGRWVSAAQHWGALPLPLRSARLAPFFLAIRLVLGGFVLQAGWSLARALPAQPFEARQALGLGLTLSGIAVMLGFLTGPSALIAGCLSAGLWASLSPLTSAAFLALTAVLLVGWRYAGWLGFDRWLLPLIGLSRGDRFLVRRESERWKEP